MQKKSSIVGGIILILVGIFFLLLRVYPDLMNQLDIGKQWPLIVIGCGGLFLIAALVGTPPLAIPGSIISGIGGILYYQNLTGNWASWAFAWALIPSFVGVGTLLMGLLNKQGRYGLREGGRLIVISLALFLVFGGFFSGLGSIGQFWPVLLIIGGGWMLIQSRRGK